MAAVTVRVRISPSPLTKYVGLTAVLGALVALTYLMKIFPDWVGAASIGSFVPSVAYFVAHDLEGTRVPNGMPKWTTLVIVTVASAVVGAVGYFSLSNGTLELTAGLSWLIVVLGAVFHSISEDKGAGASETTEAWVTAGLGIAIGLLSFFVGHPTAGVASWVATITVVVPQYIHITTDGSTIEFQPTTNPPAPPGPPTTATG